MAHLDALELLPAGHPSRRQIHEDADGFIGGLQGLARTQQQSWRNVEAYRVCVLRANWHAAAAQPDLIAARRELQAARELDQKGRIHLSDLPIADSVSAELTDCIIGAVEALKDTDRLAAVTEQFRELARQARQSNDLVLGGEATVRAALLNVRLGREQVALGLLEEWRRFYEPKVDNVALGCIAHLAEENLHVLSFPIDATNLSISANVEALRERLAERAMLDGASDAECARRLGITKGEFRGLRSRVLRRKQENTDTGA